MPEGTERCGADNRLLSGWAMVDEETQTALFDDGGPIVPIDDRPNADPNDPPAGVLEPATLAPLALPGPTAMRRSPSESGQMRGLTPVRGSRTRPGPASSGVTCAAAGRPAAFLEWAAALPSPCLPPRPSHLQR